MKNLYLLLLPMALLVFMDSCNTDDTVDPADIPELNPESLRINELKLDSLNIKVVEIPTEDINLYYEFQSGTAKAGVDFEASSGPLIIKEGVADIKIPVLIYADTLMEQEETFKVVIKTGENGLEVASTEVTITDLPIEFYHFLGVNENDRFMVQDNRASGSLEFEHEENKLSGILFCSWFKTDNFQNAEGSITLNKSFNKSSLTVNDFASIIEEGSIPFGDPMNQLDGVSLSYTDQNDVAYNTANEPGIQTGSSFEIVRIVKVTDRNYDIWGKFNCIMYSESGQSLVINHGIVCANMSF